MKNLILNIAFFLVSATSAFAVNTQVLMHTSEGTLEIELFDETQPITVANFLNYIVSGRYDGTFFHRYVENFVIQGGGFLRSGAAIVTDPAIVNEPGRSNLRGTIAMAKTSDPDSATSQFFINLADNLFLDVPTNSGGFTVFGEVSLASMNSVVTDIEATAAPYSLGPAPFGEVPLVPYEDTSDPNYIGTNSAGEDLGLIMLNSFEVLPSSEQVHMPEPGTYVLLGSLLMMSVLVKRSRKRGAAHRAVGSSQ